MNTQRNYKDTVYRMLFKEPAHALSLYNSLNGTAYTDESLLEFNTLENAIYMGMKNDLSFFIMSEMPLYEQQSTYTPNMPLRNLFYVADLLQAFVKDRPLYSSRQIRIPAPRFVVLYNGTEDIPDRMELKLSDAFETKSGEPELELKVQVYNINRGRNEDLKEKCPILKEYMIYVEKVRENVKLMPLEEAVERAIEDCIRNNVLKDFLLKQRAEVFKMSIYEYDKERDFKLLREEERKYAREEVRDEVIKEVREEMRDKMIDEVRGELIKEVREEVRDKMIDEVRGELIKEVREEVRDKVIDEVREEMRDKVIDEVREEMRDEVREEIREEARRNTERERQNAEREKENAVKAIVSLCCEYGRSQEEAVEKLMKNYALTEAEAQEKVRLYWNAKQ